MSRLRRWDHGVDRWARRVQRSRLLSRRPRTTLAAVATSVAMIAVAVAVSRLPSDARTNTDGAERAPTPLRPTAPTSSVTTAAPAAPPPALITELRDVWRRTPGGCLAVSVAGQPVFAENVDQPLVPASTMKLATAAAVLARIDPGERLSTTVAAAAPPDAGGVVSGDVWLVGGGDPVLATRAWMSRLADPAPSSSLDALADAVVAAGVRAVEGRVLGDDSRYDRLRQVPTWSQHVVDSNEIGPLSALSVNDGFRAWGGEHGIPFDDVPSGAASTFAALLVERGVRIGGPAGAGAAPPDAGVVARQESPPVGEIVSAMLRDSDNGSAELLIKELGVRVFREGSTAAGVRAVTQELRALGLPLGGVRVADGSGLDLSNRATCRFLVALLGKLPDAGAMRSALSVAGRTGTLERRFVGPPVAGRLRAKTGSLEGTASLVGFTDVPTRGAAAFAYVVNGMERSAEGVRLQEALAASLVKAGVNR